jgi:chromosome segregation ATPase
MQRERLAHLQQTVDDLEDIQHTQIELSEIKDKNVAWDLEKLNHKLHSLSNLYMGMEEKLNELAEFATQLKDEIDDLRESIKAISNRSNTDSES